MTNQLYAVIVLLAVIAVLCFGVQWTMEEKKIRKYRREFQKIEKRNSNS